MAEVAKKLILIGLDGASPELVSRFVKEGGMPHTAKIMERGVYTEALPPFPTLTPPSWTTVTTGAWPGTHGITDFYYHKPGDPLDYFTIAFDTGLCKCEYIWDTAEKVGKKSIIVKFEASWPATHKQSIQIEGLGPGGTSPLEIAPSTLFTLEDWPLVTQIRLQPAKEWKNMPPTNLPPLEGILSIQPKTAMYSTLKYLKFKERIKGEEKRFHLLLLGSRESGYNRILISRSKDVKEQIATLSVGEWSHWAMEEFKVGEVLIKGSVRFKLLKLSPDAKEFELFMPQIYPTSGFTFPESLAEEIISKFGPFLQNPGRDALDRGWIDDETFFELLEYYHTWLAEVTVYLLTNKEWDLCFVQTHASDYVSHHYLTAFDPISKYDPQEQKRAATAMARAYESMDRMIGKIIEQANEETLVIIVSDHGGTASPGERNNVFEVLEKAGLLTYKKDPETGLEVIDWTKTKAVQQRCVHVYVNLEGRDPQGIVKPGKEYEEVREKVIDALLSHRDPKTGKRVFTLALKKEDAKVLGLYGEQNADLLGDVIYAVAPEFDQEHGAQLPNTIFGLSSMRSVFIMAGPGVKRNYHLKQMMHLVDIAPTISYLLNMPVPKDAEGAILYDALEDPNIRLKQMQKLAEQRDRWKRAYEGYQRLTHGGG